MSIEQFWQARWDSQEMWGEVFLFWSFPGDQSSWFTNFPKRQLLRTKHFAPHLNGTFIFSCSICLSLCCFFFSFSSIFFGMVISMNTIPHFHSKHWKQIQVLQKSLCTKTSRYLSRCTDVSTFHIMFWEVAECSVDVNTTHRSHMSGDCWQTCVHQHSVYVKASIGRCCWQY